MLLQPAYKGVSISLYSDILRRRERWDQWQRLISTLFLSIDLLHTTASDYISPLASLDVFATVCATAVLVLQAALAWHDSPANLFWIIVCTVFRLDERII